MATVSIGLPVFNGEAFLAQALDSVRAQSYEDFELIVSDNGSTDGTAAMCREYAARDARIRVFSNRANRGAAWNYTNVVRRATGAYFKWLAADDAMERDCLARCVETLEAHPATVLAYPRARVIDDVFSRGAIRDGALRYERIHLGQSRASDRFLAMFRHVLPNVDVIWGLMRTPVVRAMMPFGDFIGADECFLARLALRGTFVEVPEPLLVLRWHPGSYGCTVGATVRSGGREGAPHAQWYNPRHRGRRVFPHWRRLGEHARSVLTSRTGAPEKARMLLVLARVANWHRAALKAEIALPSVRALG
jgi:glycosyltransferase involved in cell wall biosynthesis